VTAKVDNGAALAELGKLAVMKFDHEQSLEPAGNGLYSSSETPIRAEYSHIVQGAIERSNVSAVNEITQMIKIMRSYEQTVNMIGQENQRINQALVKLSKTVV
jgi:flagellar basal-body rod protein FlgF